MAVSAKKFSACRALAESGDPEAQKTLGTYYAEGNGVEQSDTEAIRWFRAAAKQNNPEAQYYLGLCAMNGKGLPRDEAEGLSGSAPR